MSEIKVNKISAASGSPTQVEVSAATVKVSGTLSAGTVNGPSGLTLQHNGSTKVATSTTGVTVTGTVAATAFSGDGSALTGIVTTGTGGSSSTGSLSLISDSGNGGTAGRDIVFLTGTAERARINRTNGNVAFDTNVLYVDAGNNRVGVNNGTPAYELDVAGATNITGNLTVDTNVLAVDTTNNRVGINNSTPTVALDVTGTVKANIITTGTVSVTSGQIAFPATQNASTDANTLDDYKEGTFTPALVGSTTAGSLAYSTQAGRYTKIGRLVMFDIYLVWGAVNTAPVGNMTITFGSLPYVASNNPYGCVSIGRMASINVATAGQVISGWVNSSVGITSINLVANTVSTTGSTQVALTTAPAANGNIMVSGSFTV